MRSRLGPAPSPATAPPLPRRFAHHRPSPATLAAGFSSPLHQPPRRLHPHIETTRRTAASSSPSLLGARQNKERE
ncbi:unnamed protein product [Linum trigynum]|uniref:Uncharacterized protein n=1 Tax=Linum trigynum TaxID=586398 RepID=A0AAV2GEA1_9ROSI